MTDEDADRPSPSSPCQCAVTPDGWTVWRYRGAEIRTRGAMTQLHLAGHPYDGQTGFSFEVALQLVDSWWDPAARPCRS